MSKTFAKLPPRRQPLAQLIARTMAEEQIADYHQARNRVLRGQRIPKAQQPTNLEIESALRDYLALFQPEHPQRLQQRRCEALKLMQLLQPFEPQLTGALVREVVLPDSAVVLHIYGEPPEPVLLRLREHGIEVSQREQELTSTANHRYSVPCLSFYAGETPMEIWCLPQALWRSPPRCPIDTRAVKRVDQQVVERWCRPASGP
ncbi:hypothetical protein D5085_05485 [Ectothiorhodospiraceae bacterium BW-2]|nr:hypothetical protein D5085_05485 [Ectothiorhodospiraceae bacterium BW-2]